MKTFCLSALFLTAGVAFVGHVQAQSIYRCGNAYSQFPCPGAVSMEMTDARAPEQKAQTQAAALTDARLANTMEQERLAEEKRLQAANQSSPEKPKRVDTRVKKSRSGDTEIPAGDMRETPKKTSSKKAKKRA